MKKYYHPSAIPSDKLLELGLELATCRRNLNPVKVIVSVIVIVEGP